MPSPRRSLTRLADAARYPVDSFTRGAHGNLQRAQSLGTLTLLVQERHLKRQRSYLLRLREKRRSLCLPLIEPAQLGGRGVPPGRRRRGLSRYVGKPRSERVVLLLQTSPGVER